MKQGWEYKKIKDVTSLFADGDWIESKDQSESGIRLIQTGNIGDGFYVGKEDRPHYISEETFDKLKCTEIFEGDCLISRLPQPLGRSCILPKLDSRAITAVDCSILRFKSTCIPQYFVYYTQSHKYQNTVDINATGTTRKRISRKNLENMSIPVPPLQTQQSIVSELDSLSQIIADCKETLKDYDALEQSIFYDMFGDPVKNEKGWDFVPFESLTCSMTKGPFGSDIKKSLYVPKSDDTYKVYIQVNAINNDASLGDYYISKEYFDEKMNKFEVKPNDYLITCDGTLGKFIRLPENIEKGIISASLLRLTLNDKIKFEYFEFLWNQYMLGELIKDVRNAALKHLPSASNIGRLFVPHPTIDVQQQFADKIKAIEQMKSDTKAALQEAETLFNARMDYWFN